MTTTTPVLSTSAAELRESLATLRGLAAIANNDEEARLIASKIAQITRQYRIKHGVGLPKGPAEQALEIDPGFRAVPHIQYLSERLALATHDVERGKNRQLAISMPPRAGKSTLASIYTPLWILRRHPEWKIMLVSHDGDLSGAWARVMRRTIEEKPQLGIALSRDSGAQTRWETMEGGGVLSRSTRGALTGRGANVVIIDDPVRDFVESHSVVMRQNLWDWWLSVVQTRLEPPYLILVVMTRWHEDDFIGRLMSADHEGNPKDWEQITLPAIAEKDDQIDRNEGEPLLSPLWPETPGQAAERWAQVRVNVGTYTFSSMYQQRPAPAKGAIFDMDSWRFWTSDPGKATDNGKVIFFDPSAHGTYRWLDSWDMSFKASPQDKGGWVVGQRWCRVDANRFLIAQKRGQWSFTQTIAQMLGWAETDEEAEGYHLYNRFVHERVVEERANGAAIIDVLRDKISGLKPTNPTISKEARARVVTPEIESGNVFLPLPSDPGNEWVQMDLLSELRNFPYDAYDDQVDSLTQGLTELRTQGRSSITVPGSQGRTAASGGPQGWQVSRDIARAAMSSSSRRYGR